MTLPARRQGAHEGLRSYRQLVVWQRGMRLVLACYEVVRSFPSTERFGLAEQLRRASVSVPANIAEGYGRLHRGDYVRHLAIANGSLKEVETHVLIAHRLGYLTDAQLDYLEQRSADVGRPLTGLIAALRK